MVKINWEDYIKEEETNDGYGMGPSGKGDRRNAPKGGRGMGKGKYWETEEGKKEAKKISKKEVRKMVKGEKPKDKKVDNKKTKMKEGDFEMSVVANYLQCAVGGDADEVMDADKAKVAKGKNDAAGKGNTSKTAVSDKTGSAVKTNPKEKVNMSGPKLGDGADEDGGKPVK